MDYEKKYKEALERARTIIYDDLNPCYKNTVEWLFPELKESEDEKMRKKCIKYLDWEYQSCGIKEHKKEIEECIAWLEKQGEKKPETWNTEDEQNLDVTLCFIPDEYLRRWLKDKLSYDLNNKLDADKVIEWIEEHVPTKFEDMQNYVEQFKKAMKGEDT